MKMKKIKELLANIGKELQSAEDIEAETHAALKDLNSSVEGLSGPGNVDIQPVLDTVKALESRFAVRHPVLERMAVELADAIAKMGI